MKYLRDTFLIVHTASPPETQDPFFLVDCDFEGPIFFCHYTNDDDSNGKWHRISGQLNSKPVGPVADHTYGNGNSPPQKKLMYTSALDLQSLNV